jgi:hypothetical protein
MPSYRSHGKIVDYPPYGNDPRIETAESCQVPTVDVALLSAREEAPDHQTCQGERDGKWNHQLILVATLDLREIATA